MAVTDVSKDVKYLSKDFASFRNGLIEFAKTYFPNTYNDFNESDPGMMFIEMASYVGDVLSYYIDEQFKESMLSFAEEKRTIYQIAQGYGYKPRQASPASVLLDVFQTVPSDPNNISEGKKQPNEDYCLTVPAGMQSTSVNGTVFRTVDDCIFADSSSLSPRQEDIFEVDGNSSITKWLLKKSVKAVSGTITTDYISFGEAEKYKRVALETSPVLEILSVIDSDGNNWYEVPFLAQDTVYTDMANIAKNDDELYTYSDQAPYLLKLLKTARRFTTFIREDGKTELRFGAGTSDSPDEEIIPNPDEVGSSLPGSPSKLGTAFDPSNFLKTKAYGQAPSNTQLTITYRYGGGVNHNVRSNSLRNINSIEISLDESGLTTSLVNQTKASVAVNNVIPGSGGKDAESIIEVKNNALAYFQAQQRAVTKEDYITRVYALPPKYGNIAKCYIVQDTQLDSQSGANSDSRIINPLALNLYTLGFDAGKKLTTVNKAVKENIQTYLTQFRMVTDAVNIKDAFVINVGIKFNLLTKVGYNKEPNMGIIVIPVLRTQLYSYQMCQL